MVVPVFFVIVLVAALVVSPIVILVAGRRDEDVDGGRTLARYIGAVCFVALFTGVLASYSAVASLSDLVVNHDEAFGSDHGGSRGPLPQFAVSQGGRSDDVDYRSAMQYGLVTAAAACVLVFHLRRRRELLAVPRGAAASVGRATVYAVCFTAVLILLFSASLGAYGLFRIVAPGVASARGGTFERQRGTAQLISFAYLALVAAAVFVWQWRALEPHAARARDAGELVEPRG